MPSRNGTRPPGLSSRRIAKGSLTARATRPCQRVCTIKATRANGMENLAASYTLTRRQLPQRRLTRLQDPLLASAVAMDALFDHEDARVDSLFASDDETLRASSSAMATSTTITHDTHIFSRQHSFSHSKRLQRSSTLSDPVLVQVGGSTFPLSHSNENLWDSMFSLP